MYSKVFRGYNEVGGWDTTIRREQYEKLFYNQQSSIVEDGSESSSTDIKNVDKEQNVQVTTLASQSHSAPIVQPQRLKDFTIDQLTSMHSAKDDFATKTQLDELTIGRTVVHKKFGKGIVVKINKNDKFIYFRFTVGEKKFIFPDAFEIGFLEME